MLRSITKESIFNIENHKLFLLYREKLEYIIKNLNSSVKEILPIDYKFTEDDDFDNNYLTYTNIKRKWKLKSIIPEPLKLLIPSSFDFTTWYDNAIWSGIDYEYCQENDILDSLTDEQLDSFNSEFIITPTLDGENDFYKIKGKNFFIRHGKDQTKFKVDLTIELNYNLISQNFSALGLENTIEFVIDKLFDLLTIELEKNMCLIAEQISEKYK